MSLIRRPGITRVEVVVLLCILFLPCGLFVMGLKKAQDGALNSRCAMNLRQIGLSVHNYASTYQDRLPGLAGTVERPNGGENEVSLWFTLLPFVESNPIYGIGINGQRGMPPHEALAANSTPVKSLRVSLFICPFDLSVGNGGMAQGGYTACTSYAPSFPLFGPQVSKYTIQVPDGNDYTIMFAEKYGKAGTVENQWAVPRSSRFFDPGQDTGSLTFKRAPQLGVAFEDADPGRPSSFHRPTSLVLMADGRVVPVAASISDQVWEALVDPEDGRKYSAEEKRLFLP